jgi:hypothetical protein
VVTTGVREQAVKPATEFAGYFTMSLLTYLRREKRPREKPCGAEQVVGLMFLVAGTVWLQPAPAGAASVTTTFQVTARVVKSCKLSPESMVTQAASRNGTITVNCGTGAEPTNFQSGAMSAGTASPNANVNYGLSELPGTDGAVKIITIHF